MKVLITDDNAENRYMLEALLKGNGYEVETASDGKEALDRLRADGADIVVSDILMPGMDGYMLCRAIRADEALKGIPFVFYTATYTDPKDFELGLSLGADLYLVKPTEPGEILQALREVVDARRSPSGGESGFPSPEEMEYLRRHNEVLVRKLEKKMAALETTNRELEREMRSRERTEELLRQSQKMEALGTMAGGVAHDFNNELTVILSCASMLRMHLESDTKTHSLVNEIIASVGRAVDMTRSLLAFSRRQASKFFPTDINKVVSDLRKTLRRLIREDIEFRFRLHAAAVPVMLDRGQIEQVIVNLAVNARDAMPSGGILSISSSTVEIGGGEIGLPEGVRPGRYGLLSFSDTGVGMDRETQQRIFEPFFTTKEVGKGTGLGLSIVYGIIAQHGGYVHVYSEKGHGTTFNIYLPLIPDAWRATAERPETDGRRGTGTVLLVEDDEAVRYMLGEILEDNGYRVLPASNGEEGVAVFGEHGKEIVLVVSDLVMPRMNGKQMCDEIRNIGGDIPFLFLSGYPDDLYPGKRDGKTVYLNKPVMPSTLLTAAHDLVEGSGKG